MKKSLVSMLTGILLGAVLLGGAQAVAETVTGQRSTQRIYVNGRQVQMEAYNINGNNYVKLRDIGKEVGFAVDYDAATNSVYVGERPAAAATGNVEKSHDQYIPEVGDRIICDDGYAYEILDMSRYDSNVFAAGPVGELPEPICDWSAFPQNADPRMEKRHFKTDTGDDLFIRNVRETRRMEYTIYNALGKEPSAWQDGKPLATVSLTIPADKEVYAAAFWPWDASNITDLVHSRPNSRYAVEAWDYYHNGKFMYVRYIILSL
jgi:hypothetical protein